MAKVLKAFRERRHDMKRYDPGDDYPDDDAERVAYLARGGYLESSEDVKPKRRKKGADADGDPDA